MTTHIHDDALERQLRDLRRIEEQLESLATRVHQAADNAIRALNEGVPHGHQ